jgi:hypothetical protein
MKVNKEQTAVKWLDSQLKKIKCGGDMYQFCIGIDELQAIIDTAKILERQQIIDSSNHGVNFENSPFKNAENYYDETFEF